jgi:hypothetical protein
MYSLAYPTGTNSTYNLEFRAPRFRCKNSTVRQEIPLEGSSHEVSGPGFVSTWDGDHLFRLSFKKYTIGSIYLSTTGEPTYTGLVDVNETVCDPKSALFSLNITQTGDFQDIAHIVNDIRTLNHTATRFNTNVSWPPLPLTDASNWSEPLRSFTQSVARYLPVMNEMALLDSLGSQMPMESSQSCRAIAVNVTCTRNHLLDNGTAVLICDWPCKTNYNSK